MATAEQPDTAHTLDLRPSERAEVQFQANQALAHLSVASVFGHWALVVAIVATTSAVHTHGLAVAAGAVWMALLGIGRLGIARAFPRLYAFRPRLWPRLFGAGLVLSSATWGLGGSALILSDGFDLGARLVLMTMAGVSAAGLTSLSSNLRLLRLHVACTVVPIFVIGLTMPGPVRVVIGFEVIVAAFGAFLWVQGAGANRLFLKAAVDSKLLERHVGELEVARLESFEANRVKSEFLANMSHEIRTPMTAVIGYADLLLEPTLGASERINHIQTIRRNGEHLMSLVDDILDISKIEAGKMTVESIPTSPSQLIVDVASLMRVRAVEKGLAFEVKYLGAVPETIKSDPTRLRQIIMNFVGNAIKFTESGGVRIIARCEGAESTDARLVIEIADTGIGMTAAQLEKLFCAFTQADASTTRRFGGSGLGLVISKRLAGLLGAELSVESSPGRGSAFRISIPTGPLAGVKMIEGLAEAGAPDAVQRDGAHVPGLRAESRILLAEDGYDNQVLISTYLVKAGATVKVVPDGRQAVEEALAAEAAGTPYDVILMDMQMPELDGYGATSKLRLSGYARPIVAITAHAMAGNRERCESAGCDDYLTKPVNRAHLVTTVAHFVGTRESKSGEMLVSSLGDDEDMKEIVHQFVRGLPERSAAVLRACEGQDWDAVKRLAHQLKGAAGGYGFASITDAAKDVEQAVEDPVDAPSLQRRVETLADLCRRARAA
jgi:signal transduction histidine kinase/CheY-like chemotaxis protein